MFGDRYFATRQRLSEVVDGALELGRECGAGLLAEDLDGVASGGEDALNRLREPFLFLVCGEVNAGKSSFLNGLFGTVFCEAGDLPVTSKVVHYKWGDQRDAEESSMLDLRHRPVPLLRDFEAVDTPGTNSRIEGHLPLIEDYLRRADVIFFVFPVDNPWGAGTWQLVARMPEEQLENAAFIVQQTDLKDAADLEVIKGHMRTLAEQKTGMIPEIFPVSAKRALEAKKSTPMISHIWQKSGYAEVEKFVSARINRNASRYVILREVRMATQETLRKIEEHIEERADRLDRDERFLAELENEVDDRREEQATALAARLIDLGGVFLRQGQLATRELGDRMSLFASLTSLFQVEKLPHRIEKDLTEAVRESVAEQAERDGRELVTNCRSHWETVEPRIREDLAVNPPDFAKETDDLAGTRERFVERLGDAAKQSVAHLKLRSTLDLRMEERRKALRRYLSVVLLAMTAAGLLGGFGLRMWAGAGLGLAFLGLVMAWFYVKRSRRQLCRDFMERIEDLRQPFADSLAEDYKDGVREFYLEYGGLFEIVRRRIANQKTLLEPRMKRWNNLFLEIKAIEQEL
ncbi:MAG: 50S ribosome-binding GTPase [Akkermansiaceae bacterium]|jgi:GTPase SAR1 family protein